MENHVKMLITEQAAEFHREDAKILNDYGFDLHFCQKDGIQVLNAINEVNPDVVGIGFIHAQHGWNRRGCLRYGEAWQASDVYCSL